LTTIRSVSLAPDTARNRENDGEDDNGRQNRDNDEVADLEIHGDGVGRVCAETETEIEME
jgi:hypothetical protein